MNILAEQVEIVCVACGEVFATWSHENTTLPAALICPHCGHDLKSDPSFRDLASWSLDGDEDREHR